MAPELFRPFIASLTAFSDTPIVSAISERGHHAVAFPCPSNSRFAMRRSITHCPVPNAPDSWSGLIHETEPRKYWPSSLTFEPNWSHHLLWGGEAEASPPNQSVIKLEL